MKKSFTSADYQYMQRALSLAKQGAGHVNPNPMVGAVIVKDDRIIGEGFHEFYGGPHAEVNAIKNCTQKTEGASIYVTLEPCSHYGKTAPCALALIQHKFRRVVIAMKDPNPLVAGRGIKMLEDKGIEVHCGLLEEEAYALNKFFIKNITKKQPYIILKTAMSLDGKIATRTGDSKWISGSESRSIVHQLRHEMKAIMVGVNTVISDDPLLNCRAAISNPNQPIRIILDSKLRIPEKAKVLDTTSQATIVLCTSAVSKTKVGRLRKKGVEILFVEAKDQRIDLQKSLEMLSNRGIDSILLEGGGTVNYSALEAGIVDEVVSFVAPKIIGGKDAKSPVEGVGFENIASSVELDSLRYKQIGNDIMILGKIKK